MTDEEIIALAGKTYKDKPQEGCVFCDDCPLFTCSESQECVLTAYQQGFFDGFKATYNEIKIDVNKLTVGDVICAIKQNSQYAELILRSIEEDFRDIMIRNDKKKHNDNN